MKAKYPIGTWVTGTMASLEDGKEYDGIVARVVLSKEVWSTRLGNVIDYKLKDHAGAVWVAHEDNLDRASDGPRGWEPREST